MLTSGFFAALAEILAGRFAGVAPRTAAEAKVPKQQQARTLFTHLEAVGLNERALKMFVYGFAISAPLGHVMTDELLRLPHEIVHKG